MPRNKRDDSNENQPLWVAFARPENAISARENIRHAKLSDEMKCQWEKK